MSFRSAAIALVVCSSCKNEPEPPREFHSRSQRSSNVKAVESPATPVAAAEPAVGSPENDVPTAAPAKPSEAAHEPPVDPMADQLPFLSGLHEAPPGAMNEEGIKLLLLRHPEHALQLLAESGDPTGWNGELLRELNPVKKPTPGAVIEQPVIDAPFSGDSGPAWVAWSEVTFTPVKGKPMQLPINTPVTVLSSAGEKVRASVALATHVQFDAETLVPTVLAAQPVEGTVSIAALSSSPASGSTLRARLKKLESTTEALATAIMLWQRIYGIERTAEARKGWLDAAWKARRSDQVRTVVVSEQFIKPSAFSLASFCSSAVGPQTRFIPMTRVIAKPPADESVCVLGRDPVEPCPHQVKALEAFEVQQKSLQAFKQVHELQFTADASTGRGLWFYAAPIQRREGCEPNDDYDLQLRAIRVRKLWLPLGTESQRVFVQLPTIDGVEYGVAAARSEGKAQAWLRKRASVRWSVGGQGQLNPVLGLGDVGYAPEKDVVSVSTSLVQRRPCECDAPVNE